MKLSSKLTIVTILTLCLFLFYFLGSIPEQNKELKARFIISTSLFGLTVITFILFITGNHEKKEEVYRLSGNEELNNLKDSLQVMENQAENFQEKYEALYMEYNSILVNLDTIKKSEEQAKKNIASMEQEVGKLKENIINKEQEIEKLKEKNEKLEQETKAKISKIEPQKVEPQPPPKAPESVPPKLEVKPQETVSQPPPKTPEFAPPPYRVPSAPFRAPSAKLTEPVEKAPRSYGPQDQMEKEEDILVIDTDGIVLNLFRNDLYKSGFSVHVARAGKEALKKLSLIRNYSLVILSLGTSDMKWQELVEEIKKINPQLSRKIIYFIDEKQNTSDVETIKNSGNYWLDSSTTKENFQRLILEISKGG